MKQRITQVTTRGGDTGQSSLADGTRLAKHAPRFEAIGTVDELNSQIGLLMTEPLPDGQHQILQDIQQSLFDLGGALAVPNSQTFPSAEHLDVHITRLNGQLPPLTEFVLPGGRRESALAHICRTVCRRAERTVWALSDTADVDATYLNRLSDYFFVLARTLNAGTEEVQWRGPE